MSALPDFIKESRFEIRKAIEYGKLLGLKYLHVMVGNIPKTKNSTKTFCENLCYACDLANKYAINVLIEPLNSVDHPNYYLSSIDLLSKYYQR